MIYREIRAGKQGVLESTSKTSRHRKTKNGKREQSSLQRKKSKISRRCKFVV